MKRTLLAFIIGFMLLPWKGQAQTDYAAGTRVGNSTGFSMRYFKDEDMVIEGLLTFRHGGIQVTGIWERYRPLFNIPGGDITIYYGLGGHIGINRWAGFFGNTDLARNKYYIPSIGVDGMLSFNYELSNIPLSLSLDYKPYAGLFEPNFLAIHGGDMAVAIRYHFNLPYKPF